jgi:hypothetical protein
LRQSSKAGFYDGDETPGSIIKENFLKMNNFAC